MPSSAHVFSAAPSDSKVDDLSRSVDRIADAVEKIQRDGLEVKVQGKWGDPIHVKIDQ